MPATDIGEFDKLLNLLPWPPWLIPVTKNGKEPDIPEGQSWKDAKWRLTVKQARQRIKDGLNVGVVATGRDLVIFDHDQPEKFTLPIETLTVMTRNGKIHKYFINGGDVKNGDGKGKYKGCGEVRAEWKFVLAPGCYVPPDEDATPEATGLYKVVVAKPPATLYSKDLPVEFQPTLPTEEEAPKLVMGGSFRNRYGWSLDDIRKRDQKLNNLLTTIHPTGYASPSEADMSTLTKLLFWGYTESEAVGILKHFRSRKKLDRKDYIDMTLKKVGAKETISDLVDTTKWNPETGYKVDLEKGVKTVKKKDKSTEEILKIGENLALVVKPEIVILRDVKTNRELDVIDPLGLTKRLEKKRVAESRELEEVVVEEAFAKAWKILNSMKRKLEVGGGEEEDVIPEEAVKEAKELLKSSSLLYEIRHRLGSGGYVGEDKNKLLIYLLGLSGYKEPQSMVLSGESSVGKSILSNIISRYYPKADVMMFHRMTRTAPEYLGREIPDVTGKFIIIKEIPGVDESLYSVRLMVEDQETGGLNLLTTVTDEEGERTVSEIRLKGKPCLLTTTTRVAIDRQLDTRVWNIGLDETTEQTSRICDRKADYREKPWEREKARKPDPVLRAIIRIYKEKMHKRVIIPFAHNIKALLPMENIRVRRDIDKVFELTEIITSLHQYQRIWVKGEDGVEYIVAAPHDFYYAWCIASETVSKMISTIQERALKVYKVFEDRKKEEEVEMSVDEVMKELGERRIDYSLDTIYETLRSLSNRGFLQKRTHPKDKRKVLYSLTDKEISGFSVFSQNQQNLNPEFQTTFENYLTKYCFFKPEGNKINFTVINPIPFEDIEGVEVVDVTRRVYSHPPKIKNLYTSPTKNKYPLKPESTAVSQKQPEKSVLFKSTQKPQNFVSQKIEKLPRTPTPKIVGKGDAKKEHKEEEQCIYEGIDLNQPLEKPQRQCYGCSLWIAYDELVWDSNKPWHKKCLEKVKPKPRLTEKEERARAFIISAMLSELKTFTFDDMYESVTSLMKWLHKADLDKQTFKKVLDRLVNEGMIKQDGARYKSAEICFKCWQPIPQGESLRDDEGNVYHKLCYKKAKTEPKLPEKSVKELEEYGTYMPKEYREMEEWYDKGGEQVVAKMEKEDEQIARYLAKRKLVEQECPECGKTLDWIYSYSIIKKDGKVVEWGHYECKCGFRSVLQEAIVG